MSQEVDEFQLAFSQGDVARAEQIALAAVSRGQSLGLWLCRVGQCCQAQGRLGEALASYDRAIAADPLFVEALLNSALLLSELGFYEEAAARMDAARALDGQFVQLPQSEVKSPKASVSFFRKLAADYAAIAQNYCDIEDWAQARREIERALEVSEAASLRLMLAKILIRLGEPLAAQGELAKVASTYVENPEYHQAVAQCLVALRKNDEARTSLAKCEELAPPSRTADVLSALTR